jgi:nitroreductase
VTKRSQLDRLAGLVSSARGFDSYVPHDPRTGKPYAQYSSTVLDSAAVLLEVPATIWVENIGAFSGGRNVILDSPREAIAAVLEGYGFEMIGIGAAIENMWLAANALGLAAVFMGDVVIATEEIRELLHIRGDLSGVLAMGYSSAEPRAPMDKRSEEHVERIVWH